MWILTRPSHERSAQHQSPSAQFKTIKLQNSTKGVEARHGSTDRSCYCSPSDTETEFAVSYRHSNHSSRNDGFTLSLREPITATRYPSTPSSGGCEIEPAIVLHVCCLHFVVEISQYSLHFVCLLRSCPPKMLLYELVAVSCPAFLLHVFRETTPKINLQRYCKAISCLHVKLARSSRRRILNLVKYCFSLRWVTLGRSEQLAQSAGCWS